ncbi:VWA domain-containing protein [Zooshikella marina]|uniref:vWA domain-containing protein n=1 Tax=Zooshikella ganghwensis TaxID=202772 RepID=UPI001BAF133A|nr:VWA domain-containing protein [Zooshikella ganghwensis]MBU2707022.1 VWA domain-containing protein [Zooshikella ganghwensis]
MLVRFFLTLKSAQIPVSIRELLDLLTALETQLVFASLDDFYYLARTCLIKDERFFDRYDQAFSQFFTGIAALDDVLATLIPEDWLRKEFIRQLTPEEKQQIEALGGLEKLLETFKKRLQEQQSRHQGGNRWIGTGGTSPFGAYGYNPEGIRIGQHESRQQRAVKVWDQRQFRNLDGDVEIGTRNIKLALRHLRKFARTGASEHLDLEDTISSTAKNAGLLDVRMQPERHNAVKVLLFMDIGGTMDAHVQVCEELFTAARSEFKHLVLYYFHNFIYESVWQNNLRRQSERIPTWDILHRYGEDYKVIFVGDATMSPYEISYPGGSVEHWNEEPGSAWMQRFMQTYSRVVWLNPYPEANWSYTPSTIMIQQLVKAQMYPLTLQGLEGAMKYLRR